jgi:hypothetical protein
LGLTVLAGSLRQFDIAEDRAGMIGLVRDAATEALRTLRRWRSALTQDDDQH